jgi:hypothetical protein
MTPDGHGCLLVAVLLHWLLLAKLIFNLPAPIKMGSGSVPALPSFCPRRHD